MFERIRDALGSIAESVCESLQKLLAKLKGLFSSDEPVGTIEKDGSRQTVNTIGTDVKLTVKGSDDVHPNLLGTSDGQLVVDDFDYTFNLSRGATVIEETALMSSPQKWNVEDIHREDGDVVAYTFRVEDGNHKEYWDADTVQKMIGDGTLNVQSNSMWDSSSNTMAGQTFSGSFSITG